MGGPLSVILADIYMTKIENEIVRPLSPSFYHRYVDDIITRRTKNEPDKLFKKLNEKKTKLKFTCEVQPTKFLDTVMIQQSDNTFKTAVHRKIMKVAAHWSSKVPKKYKRNAIRSDLSRAARISSNFNEEKQIIHEKFSKVGFPKPFIDSVFRQYHDKKNPVNNDAETPVDPPKKVTVEIPYCELNENASRKFIRKFYEFTGNRYQLVIKWKTKKVKNLFFIKDKNPHLSLQIYEGVCSCGDNYIGETERNVVTRWEEHENPGHNSEPAKHLKANPTHTFSWRCIIKAPKGSKERKFLEASFISTMGPSLNNQVETKTLQLFRNGVT